MTTHRRLLPDTKTHIPRPAKRNYARPHHRSINQQAKPDPTLQSRDQPGFKMGHGITLKVDLRRIDRFPYHALDQPPKQTRSPFYEALDKQP